MPLGGGLSRNGRVAPEKVVLRRRESVSKGGSRRTGMERSDARPVGVAVVFRRATTFTSQNRRTKPSSFRGKATTGGVKDTA